MRKAPLSLSTSKCNESVLLPTLESRRKYLFLVQVHKDIYSAHDRTLSEFIPISDIKFYSNLRSNNSNNVLIPKCNKTNYGMKSFSYLTSKVWNQLPIGLKKEGNLNIFKRKIRDVIYDYWIVRTGVVLYGINQTNIKHIERMQKWAIRVMRKAPLSLSTSKCNESVLLPTLESRRKYLFLVQVHKAIYSAHHRTLSEFIPISDNKFYRNLRSNNSNNVHIPKCNKTNYGMK